MYYQQIYQSPLGSMTLIGSDRGLRAVWFEGQAHRDQTLEDRAVLQDHPILQQATALLAAYFRGEKPSFSSLSLDLSGTDFQVKVWQLLQGISYGETSSYGQLADQLGLAAAQAVGGAVGRNPLSIIIPCHRVLGSKGQLIGYAGGLERKLWLLQHEKAISEVNT